MLLARELVFCEMPDISEPIPEEEILIQLDRILGSRWFRIAPRQSQILKFIVTRALAGKPISEEIIGRSIYRGKYVKDGTNVVRVHAASLRENIPKYYAGPGANDPIQIRMPDPGAEYSD